jgi:hypothetical protein
MQLKPLKGQKIKDSPRSSLYIGSASLPISGPKLPISGPKFPISGPNFPISGPKYPISGPNLPIGGSKLPISSRTPGLPAKPVSSVASSKLTGSTKKRK